jgi:hypothetical protein
LIGRLSTLRGVRVCAVTTGGPMPPDETRAAARACRGAGVRIGNVALIVIATTARVNRPDCRCKTMNWLHTDRIAAPWPVGSWRSSSSRAPTDPSATSSRRCAALGLGYRSSPWTKRPIPQPPELPRDIAAISGGAAERPLTPGTDYREGTSSVPPARPARF